MSSESTTSTATAPPTGAATRARGLRKSRVGQVVSANANKTAVIETVTRVPHPRFGKIIKQIKKFHAHDEENTAQVGDVVRIMETRPISKLKRWRVVEILRH